MEHHGREVPSPNLPADSCEPRIYRALAAADRLAEAVQHSCDADGQVAAAGWDAIPSLLAAYLTERGR